MHLIPDGYGFSGWRGSVAGRGPEGRILNESIKRFERNDQPFFRGPSLRRGPAGPSPRSGRASSRAFPPEGPAVLRGPAGREMIPPQRRSCIAGLLPARVARRRGRPAGCIRRRDAGNALSSRSFPFIFVREIRRGVARANGDRHQATMVRSSPACPIGGAPRVEPRGYERRHP